MTFPVCTEFMLGLKYIKQQLISWSNMAKLVVNMHMLFHPCSGDILISFFPSFFFPPIYNVFFCPLECPHQSTSCIHPFPLNCPFYPHSLQGVSTHGSRQRIILILLLGQWCSFVSSTSFPVPQEKLIRSSWLVGKVHN